MWICHICGDIGIPQQRPSLLFLDNISALHLTTNPVFHAFAVGTYVGFRSKLGLWQLPLTGLRGTNEENELHEAQSTITEEDTWELLHLSEQAEAGSAWDELNRSVCTSLGHLTVTDFNAEEGSKENRTSPDKSSGYFFYLGKFPGVSSRDEDRKNDAGALEVAVEIEESKRPTEELVARVADIEDQVVKLDNFMNYVGNLESQSSVEGVILALKQNMKDMETEVKALEQKIKKLRTSLKYSDFVLTIKVLADACGIDLKK
ncbi:hypothetical protein CRG98_001343 [Punica granatum]|uniref:Uncharacterized protein n=1 Tax=Punica granatum TaxID=22663 RepID=A0A2I0LC79_PUNGR|nr:hypothetical protein CRG98_001343 [Punica granatum]